MFLIVSFELDVGMRFENLGFARTARSSVHKKKQAVGSLTRELSLVFTRACSFVRCAQALSNAPPTHTCVLRRSLSTSSKTDPTPRSLANLSSAPLNNLAGRVSRSHQLDLLDHLVGPLRPLGGAAHRLRPTAGLPGPSFAVEDAVCLSFATPSGAVGTASWNFCSGVWEDTVDVVGELGSVSFSCFNNKPVRVEVAAKDVSPPPPPPPGRVGEEATPALKRVKRLETPEVTVHQAEQPDHVHQPLVEAVLRDLRRWASLPADAPERASLAAGLMQEEERGDGDARDACCSSTGRAAARTALVMDRALEGFYGGPGSRDQAFWETPEKWAKGL